MFDLRILHKVIVLLCFVELASDLVKLLFVLAEFNVKVIIDLSDIVSCSAFLHCAQPSIYFLHILQSRIRCIYFVKICIDQEILPAIFAQFQILLRVVINSKIKITQVKIYYLWVPLNSMIDSPCDASEVCVFGLVVRNPIHLLRK